METKIGTSYQICSSFSGGRIPARRSSYANSAGTQGTNEDTFTMSSTSEPYCSLSKETREKLREIGEKFKEYGSANVKWYKLESDTPEGRTKMNFEVLDDMTKPMRENISSALENAGVPKDVTFEFDYNINTHKAEVTEISDETYLENVESVVNRFNIGLMFTSFASRVMNGYISSMYYPTIADGLEVCYGQDINDLYIDEKGNLCGANEHLQKAIKASQRGEKYSIEPHYYFPTQNIEGIVKRLISDENITPNVSHMGYDGESIYTNDGEFKFGKDFDPNLFGEEKYVMRGSISLFINNGYDRWLENEKKFY